MYAAGLGIHNVHLERPRTVVVGAVITYGNVVAHADRPTPRQLIGFHPVFFTSLHSPPVAALRELWLRVSSFSRKRIRPCPRRSCEYVTFSIVIVVRNSPLARKRPGKPFTPPTRPSTDSRPQPPVIKHLSTLFDPNHDHGRSRPTPSKSSNHPY